MNDKIPVQKTGRIVRYDLGGRNKIAQWGMSSYPGIYAPGHYSRSIGNQRRIPVQYLRALAETIPAQRCFRRISTTICTQHWSIHHKDVQELDGKAKEKAREDSRLIEFALKKPNEDAIDSYFTEIMSGAIKHLLMFNFAMIERQKGKSPERPFWLWLVQNPEDIQINPEWSPDKDGIIVKYLDFGHTSEYGYADPQEIKSENLFCVQGDNWDTPSPLEVAYNAIESWLGLCAFQQSTTSNATREYMLILEDVTTEEELVAFREYWNIEVKGSGKVPILNGRVNVAKLGAKTDDELYLRYEEYLRRMIALAFGMTPLDMNISEHDNRATAGVSADRSFQDAVLPLMQKVEQIISREVVEYYCPDFVFEFNDLEKRNEADEANTASMLYEKGLLTKNEARMRIGAEPVADGDTFKAGGGEAEGQPPGAPPGANGQPQLPQPAQQKPVQDPKETTEKEQKEPIAKVNDKTKESK